MAIVHLNEYYSPAILNSFLFVTRMGEWIGFALVLAIVLVQYRYRELLAYILAVLLVILCVWFFKHVIYSDAIRPSVYLERMGIELQNSSSITLHRKFSFPSGHTTAGFTFFFFLGLCFQRRLAIVLALIPPMLVALSRVYLAQHFVTDVVAGSLLGVVIASICYFLIVSRSPRPNSFLNQFINPKRDHVQDS